MGNVEIKVPQRDGEIVVARDGNVHQPTRGARRSTATTRYEVKNGKVTVAEQDAAHFLAVIDGAELAAGKPPADQGTTPPAQ